MNKNAGTWNGRLVALEALVAEQQQQIAALRGEVAALKGVTLPIHKIGGFTVDSLRQDAEMAEVLPNRIQQISDAMDEEGLGS